MNVLLCPPELPIDKNNQKKKMFRPGKAKTETVSYVLEMINVFYLLL